MGADVGEQLRFEDEEVNITLRRAWDRALRILATRLNKPTFETHIRTIRPVSLTETQEKNRPACRIQLGVPSAFTREWVEKRHAVLIAQILEELFDRDIQLEFVLLPKEAIRAEKQHNTSPSLLEETNSQRPGEYRVPTNCGYPPSEFSERSKPSGTETPPLSPTRSKRPGKPLSFDLDEDNKVDDRANSTSLPGSYASERVSGRQNPPSEKPRKPTKSPGEMPYAGDSTSHSSRASKRVAEEKSNTLTPYPPGESMPPTVCGSPPSKFAHPLTVGTRSKSPSEYPATDTPLLNTRYTFDTFVVGTSNRLAHAGAAAVAQAPGAVYNPLFLYGPPGLGKTHLMHAIGNEIAQVWGMDTSRIAYLSGESFASYFITSLREHRTEEFRRKWRSVDLFLVDDIQFIAGKEQTKEEFFHTFNTLYQMGKQIVISSDRSPRELRTMDERLRSRFECGLIADIAPPDLETRLAILHRKAEVERMRIPDDVLLYMAKLIQSNIRTLEGALVKLIAYASLQNSPVTTDLASSILEHYYISAGIGNIDPNSGNNNRTEYISGDGRFPHATNAHTFARQPHENTPTARTGDSLRVPTVSGWANSEGGDPQTMGGLYSPGGYPDTHNGLRPNLSRDITPEMIQRVVASRFGINADALVGKKRDKEVVHARQVAMHLMRELTEISLPGIGEFFGGRDHSTVSHACDKVKNQLPLDDSLRHLIEDLITQIRAQAHG